MAARTEAMTIATRLAIRSPSSRWSACHQRHGLTGKTRIYRVPDGPVDDKYATWLSLEVMTVKGGLLEGMNGEQLMGFADEPSRTERKLELEMEKGASRRRGCYVSVEPMGAAIITISIWPGPNRQNSTNTLAE